MFTTKNFILISKLCEQYDNLMTAIYYVFGMLSVTLCVCVCVCVGGGGGCTPYLQCPKIPGNLMNQKVLYSQPKLKSCF